WFARLQFSFVGSIGTRRFRVAASNGRKYLFTSESVTEGHPDKICDQISDAVLDAVLAEDPRGRVACEAMVKDDAVYVAGEITTSAKPDIEKLVRQTVGDIGYKIGRASCRERV